MALRRPTCKSPDGEDQRPDCQCPDSEDDRCRRNLKACRSGVGQPELTCKGEGYTLVLPPARGGQKEQKMKKQGDADTGRKDKEERAKKEERKEERAKKEERKEEKKEERKGEKKEEKKEERKEEKKEERTEQEEDKSDSVLRQEN